MCQVYYYPNFWWPSTTTIGLAGLSFCSVATGLNIALVKFEMFQKTLDHVKNGWQKIISDILSQKQLSFVAVDSSSMEGWQRMIETKFQRLLTKYGDLHDKVALDCRRVAIHITVWGLICLFVHCSAGVLGIVFLLPIALMWISKQLCGQLLVREAESLMDFANDMADEITKQNADATNRMKKDLSRGIPN